MLNRLLLFSMALIPAVVQADIFPRNDIITDPTPELFTVCYNNGCSSLGFVSLSLAQWAELRAFFLPLPTDAADERERIRGAIALLEKFVGVATGTSNDKGGTFNGGVGQMDCIDESTNTTLYLTLLQKYGLLRHHRVEDRATRGWFVFGWPHTTAVVREIGNGALWAVDSWFLDNGEPPFILPLRLWNEDWHPDSSPVSLPGNESGKMPASTSSSATDENHLSGF